MAVRAAAVAREPAEDSAGAAAVDGADLVVLLREDGAVPATTVLLRETPVDEKAVLPVGLARNRR